MTPIPARRRVQHAWEGAPGPDRLAARTTAIGISGEVHAADGFRGVAAGIDGRERRREREAAAREQPAATDDPAGIAAGSRIASQARRSRARGTATCMIAGGRARHGRGARGIDAPPGRYSCRRGRRLGGRRAVPSCPRMRAHSCRVGRHEVRVVQRDRERHATSSIARRATPARLVGGSPSTTSKRRDRQHAGQHRECADVREKCHERHDACE